MVVVYLFTVICFFFKQKTAYEMRISDWSSDVCSSDLIVAIEEALGTLRITLRDPDAPDGGEVTLVFADEPLALKKWELTDPQGIHTQVSLINPVYGEAVDPGLFKYGDLEIYRGGRRQDR